MSSWFILSDMSDIVEGIGPYPSEEAALEAFQQIKEKREPLTTVGALKMRRSQTQFGSSSP